MRRTLFLIPHEIGGIPVFGIGWLLALFLVGFAVRLVIARNRGQSIPDMLLNEGLMWGAVAAAVVFLLPTVELQNLDGEPVGMAVRGYGVMLLTGVGCAVLLAAYRAKQRGFDPELIYSIAPWAFFGGIIGARLFFVIQYRDDFIADSIGQTIANMLKFTEGGLVVYGSFIGGFLAVSFYLILRKLPWLKFGDVIVPCMFLGVFFGRIGCVMNGCCYGGRCEDNALALNFPPTSPVYQEQLRSGDLLGIQFDPDTRVIESVREGSLAADAGIQAGTHLDTFADDLTPLETASREIPREDARTGVVMTVDGRRYRWSPEELPATAMPVFAAQLLSSICSLILCGLLCAIPPNKFRDGTVMMLGFAGYAVLRFVLELVRVDEGGQFGTDLSISQWVSVIVLSGSILGSWWIYRSPADVTLNTQQSPGPT